MKKHPSLLDLDGLSGKVPPRSQHWRLDAWTGTVFLLGLISGYLSATYLLRDSTPPDHTPTVSIGTISRPQSEPPKTVTPRRIALPRKVEYLGEGLLIMEAAALGQFHLEEVPDRYHAGEAEHASEIVKVTHTLVRNGRFKDGEKAVGRRPFILLRTLFWHMRRDSPDKLVRALKAIDEAGLEIHKAGMRAIRNELVKLDVESFSKLAGGPVRPAASPPVPGYRAHLPPCRCKAIKFRRIFARAIIHRRSSHLRFFTFLRSSDPGFHEYGQSRDIRFLKNACLQGIEGDLAIDYALTARASISHRPDFFEHEALRCNKEHWWAERLDRADAY